MPTFNGETLIITLDAVVDGVLNMDWKDTYSAWKNWALEGTNLKYPQAFITTGGDPINTILDSGAYYFLRNDLGWRIRPYENDGTYYASGNLTGQDANYPIFTDTIGTYTVGILGLQPVTQAISADIISQSVWDELIGDHLLPDTMGHQMYHQAYGGIVHVDAVDGAAGTVFPTGTTHQPCLYLSDALTIASNHFIDTIHFVGAYEINGEDVTGLTLAADRSLGNSLTITSMVNTGACYFTDITVSGALSGSQRFTQCVLGALTGFDGGAKDSLVTDSIAVTGSGANYLTNCDIYITAMEAYKSISVGSNLLNIIRCRGSFGIADLTGSQTISIDLIAGGVYIDSTCVSGVIGLSGIGKSTDQSGAGCTVVDNMLEKSNIAEAVHEYTLEGSLSMDEAMRLILAATAGDSQGAGTALFSYMSVDGGTARIQASFDVSGNRQITLLDAS